MRQSLTMQALVACSLVILVAAGAAGGSCHQHMHHAATPVHTSLSEAMRYHHVASKQQHSPHVH
jgi:hypothetical protein